MFTEKKNPSYDELMTAMMTKVGSYNVLWNIKTIFGIVVLDPAEASICGLGTGTRFCVLGARC